jgi:hypothetical protein
MRKLLFAGLGLLALSAALLSAAAPQAVQTTKAEEAADDDDGIQDLLYVGEPHPLLIRLNLRVVNKSAFSHYEKCMDGYFAFLDRNDNKVLDKIEASRPVGAADAPVLPGQPLRARPRPRRVVVGAVHRVRRGP